MRTRIICSRAVIAGALFGVVTSLASTGWAQGPGATTPARSETRAGGPGPGAAAGPVAAALPPGDASRGAELYLKNGCWQCHGYGAATGTAPALVLMGFNAQGFVSYLRSPRTRAMPLYSAKVVPDAAGADLFAFIRAQKKPVEAKEIPLLQRIIDEK